MRGVVRHWSTGFIVAINAALQLSAGSSLHKCSKLVDMRVRCVPPTHKCFGKMFQVKKLAQAHAHADEMARNRTNSWRFSKSEFILFLSLTPRLSPEFLGLAPERLLIDSKLKAKHVALAFSSSLGGRCARGRSLEHLCKLLSALSCSAA
jgi:hypothetical protein